MLNLILGALARNALANVGGVIAAQGLASGDQVNTATGAAVSLASFAWSIWQKYKAKKEAVK